MQPGLIAQTVVLTATGVTAPIRFTSPTRNSFNGQVINGTVMLPGILVSLSAGASITYSVEVTGDDLDLPGYSAASGVWSTFTGMGALTASGTGSLGAAVTAIRLNATIVSGTATLQFVQVV
jgi:hypothetical protein